MTSQITACRSGAFPTITEEDEFKGNLTDLRRELHLSLAKGNPKRTL
jgi:hypothetical protein